MKNNIFRKTAQAIRNVLGRNSVDTGFDQSLTESNKLLRHLFEVRMFDLKKKPKKKKKDEENNDGEEDLVAIELDEKGYQNFQVPGVCLTNLE